MAAQIVSVRDRLWLLAHDERFELQPRIDVRALNLGLVAATLTDLLLQDRIHVQHGRIYLNAEKTGPAADPIATDVLNAIAEEHAPRMAEVIRGARAELLDDGHQPYQRLYERTVASLVAAGHLIEQRRRFRSTRYALADENLIPAARSQLNQRLARYHLQAALDIDSLCAMVLALNLHSMLPMPYGTSEAEPILLGITGRIPERAGKTSPLAILPQLVQVVRYAVGDLATAAF